RIAIQLSFISCLTIIAFASGVLTFRFTNTSYQSIQLFLFGFFLGLLLGYSICFCFSLSFCLCLGFSFCFLFCLRFGLFLFFYSYGFVVVFCSNIFSFF